jgi:hypothetical protein
MKETTLTTTFAQHEPLTIHAKQLAPNVVSVVIQIGDPKQPISRQDHNDLETKRIFGGVSFCHPSDAFNFHEGIKQACRHALGIQQDTWYSQSTPRLRAIYSACRTVIKESNPIPSRIKG